MSIAWKATGATDTGRVRQGNEDAFLVNAERGVFLVADGMGGHAAGEVASALATDTIGEALERAVEEGRGEEGISRAFTESFRTACEQMDRRSASDRRTRGMGTTVTACVLTPAGTCQIGHIGDSRAYRFRGGVLEQLTRDHTWVQQEIDQGRLSPAAAQTHPYAHILTRVLCAGTPPQPDLIDTEVRAGDLLLLSTDGLHGQVDDTEITRILLQDLPLTARVGELIAEANARGGPDNSTAVLVQVV